jgi:hypothetical protein
LSLLLATKGVRLDGSLALVLAFCMPTRAF